MKAPVGLLLLLLPSPLAAQPAPISTDRPSFSFGSTTVPEGMLQIETGAYLETFRGGGPNRVTTPTSLRLGTGEGSEFRVDSGGLTWLGSASGLADLSLGTKWHFSDDPSLALLFTLTVPTGAAAFRGPSVEPQLRLLGEFPVAEEWTVFGNAGLSLPDDGSGRRFVRGIGSLGLSHNLGTDCNLFLEGAVIGPDFPGGPTPVIADLGIQFRPSDDLQLDLALYRGLSTMGLNWGITSGLSTRF